jgi:hypothetical protein
MDACRIPHTEYLRIRRGKTCDDEDSASETSEEVRSVDELGAAESLRRVVVSTLLCLYCTCLFSCALLFLFAATLFVSWWFLAVE